MAQPWCVNGCLFSEGGGRHSGTSRHIPIHSLSSLHGDTRGVKKMQLRAHPPQRSPISASLFEHVSHSRLGHGPASIL